MDCLFLLVYNVYIHSPPCQTFLDVLNENQASMSETKVNDLHCKPVNDFL